MTTAILITVGGALILAAVVWSWRGRTEAARWWVDTISTRQLMLAVAPGFGIMTFGGGALLAARATSDELYDLGALVLGPPMLVAVVLVLLGILGLLPKWWGPRWYREKVRRQRRPPWYGF